MILELPPQTEHIITQNAQRQGITPSEYLLSLLDFSALTGIVPLHGQTQVTDELINTLRKEQHV